MKKTFKITVDDKKPERQLDAIKHEVKKYITRERKKKLPENVDFWDFNCKIGDDAETAQKIHVAEISTQIDAQLANKKDSFYLEVLAKQGIRTKKQS